MPLDIGLNRRHLTCGCPRSVPRLGTELSEDFPGNLGVPQVGGSELAQESAPAPSADIGDLARRLAALPPDTLAALNALLGGLQQR